MRKLSTPASSFFRWKSFVVNTHRLIVRRPPVTSLQQLLPSRHLAQVRTDPLSELWFTPSSPRRSLSEDLLGHPGNESDHKPPDERTLRLGKSEQFFLSWHWGSISIDSGITALRTLSPLLPNILTTPLPQEILSPSVSLHLFPSTHPHLPVVKGKVPYRAALWTAPVAWGCVPIVGNVKLNILSEKIVRTGFVNLPLEDDSPDLGEEKLVVRWKTEKKNANGTNTNAAANSSAVAGTSANGNGGINSGLSRLLGGDKPIFNLNKGDEFSGMFIFSFDSKGRIATHTIEHADESNGFDKTSKMVTLTDWLLGKARWGRGREEEMIPGLAMRVCREEWARSRLPGQGGARALHCRW
jgi:hypothetical protein